MAKIYVHTMKVRADGFVSSFPIDMLRYDSCYPDSQDDVNRIVATLDYRRRTVKDEAHVISVIHVGDKGWTPTDERWKSFGWKVIEHHIRER